MANNYKRIQLKPGKEESLLRFHPWIYSGAVQHKDSNLANGEVVAVYTHYGDFIAIGHYQEASIEVRALTFLDEEIDDDFWEKRIRAAVKFREAIYTGSSPDSIYRLINGEGDNLAGLIVDIYGQTVVVQSLSAGMHNIRVLICNTLLKVLGDAIKTVYYRPDSTLINIPELKAYNEYLHGEKGNNICEENGLKYTIDWEKGQKTGFFIDQSNNRALLETYAKDRSVLDLFSYTGGFSLCALRGGAQSVHSVDSSSRATSQTLANVELNFPDDDRHKAFADDAFKYLEQMEEDSYDLIVLDPPAFAKNRAAVRNALQGYKRLNTLAFDKIATGGLVFTFCSSQVINEESFRRCIFSAAAQSCRSVRVLHQLSQSNDHPINIYHPEGEYITGLVLYVE